jgi:hypothetical protein
VARPRLSLQWTQPLVDIKTGRLLQSWYAFFQSLTGFVAGMVDLGTDVTGRLPFSHVETLPGSTLAGRGSAGGAGDLEPITLGTNLTMVDRTLNAASTAPAFVVLTADPGAPADDTWWVVREGAGPTTVSVKARIGGVTQIIAQMEF